MSVHLDRAQLLLAQSRAADAEREAGRALIEDPRNPRALALIALARLELGQKDRALEAARAAVTVVPDEPYLHYVLGVVLHRIDRSDEALASAQEAIRLAPDDGAAFRLVASIELSRRMWPKALEAAEQALALDPEDVHAANLRSIALTQLGRKAEAVDAAMGALQRAPENAWSHCTQGWNLLHKNDPRGAQVHFIEALRLDPELEQARYGLLEALKARSPIYRVLLAYFLWMGRQSRRFQWAFIVGIYFGQQFVVRALDSQPQLKWVLWPVLIALYLFVYMSWTSGPLFNLLLRFDRFGRHVLDGDERRASNCFAPFFMGAVAALAWWIAGGGLFAAYLAFALAALSICVAGTFARRHGRRKLFGWLTAALAALAIAAFGGPLVGLDPNLYSGALLLFVYGFLGFQILANVMSGIRR